jgi:triphosphatase
LAYLTPREAVAIETELKLAARPADLPALRQALMDMAAPGWPRRDRLVSTYYETADRALARAGVVLRVREQGDRLIQTVKSLPGGGPLLASDEWEDVIAAPGPDPHAAESGRFLTADITPRLRPVFRSIVQRDRIELSPSPGTRIEAAVDRGEIRQCDGKRARRIGEIELELKSGDVSALYDVALRLLDTSPVRIELASKSARGFALSDAPETSAQAVRGVPIDLDAALSAEEALRRVGCACLDQLMRNEPAVREGRAEAVHQMRVAIRRLRAALSTFRKLLPKNQRQWAAEELHWLGNILGDARNLDVFRSTLLAPAKEALAGKIDTRVLERAVERRRRVAQSAVKTALGSTRYTGLVLRLMRWFEAREWRHSGNLDDLQRTIGDVAPAMLDRRRRTVRRRRKGFSSQSAKQRHELRLALKKLRYTADLFAGLFPKKAAGQFIVRLKHLQDELGAANDLQVGKSLVVELACNSGKEGRDIAAAGKAVLAWNARRLAKRQRKLPAKLRRLCEDKPFWRE